MIAKCILTVQLCGFGVEDWEPDVLSLGEPLFLIPTHMTFIERAELFRLARTLPAGFTACEIGAYLGASTAFLAAAATLRGGHVHTIDTWKNDNMPEEPPEDTFERFLENTRPFRHVITTHRGLTSELKDQIPAVDLLFIDGDHSYEGAKADLTNYAHKIKRGGYLAMHDFTYESVSRAFRDMRADDLFEDRGIAHSLQVFRLK